METAGTLASHSGTEVSIASFSVPARDSDDRSRTPHPAGDDAARDLLTVEILTDERAGWRLVGEIDISSRERFHDVLALLTGDRCGTDGLIHLELATLTFIDLDGTRSLIRAAQQLHDTAAARLALHDPPYTLRRVAGLLLGRVEIDGQHTLTLPVARS